MTLPGRCAVGRSWGPRTAGHPDGQACFPDAAAEDSLRRIALVAAALLPVLALTAFRAVELVMSRDGRQSREGVHPQPAPRGGSLHDRTTPSWTTASEKRPTSGSASSRPSGTSPTGRGGKEALALMASREAANRRSPPAVTVSPMRSARPSWRARTGTPRRARRRRLHVLEQLPVCSSGRSPRLARPTSSGG